MMIPASDIVKVAFRYDSGNIPPPFSHSYIIAIDCQDPPMLNIDMQYTGREQLTEQEIYEEGFTLEDDFSWRGALPPVWRKAMLEKLDRATLGKKPPAATPNDAHLEVELTGISNQSMTRYPADLEPWYRYLQEIIQAGMELSGREKPLIIKYMSISSNLPVEKKLTLVFAERKVQIDTVSGEETETTHTIDWVEGTELIKLLYALDYDTGKSTQKKPTTRGRYIDIGESTWYDLKKHVHSPTSRKNLVALLTEKLERI